MTASENKRRTPELADIEALLYREADYLDAADLNSWFELYTEDGTYWMPVSPEQTSPDTEISIFYDDRLMMELRRRNFGDALAASMEYRVRCSHLIGNIRFADTDLNDGWQILSNFQAAIYYRGRTNFYAGKYTHDIVQTSEGLKIRRKRVDLINCDSSELGSIVIYL